MEKIRFLKKKKLVNIHVLLLTLWSRLQLFARKADEKCLTGCFLFGNPHNNFSPHKAPCHTWHIWTSPFASCPSLTTHNIAFSLDCGQASAYCDVWQSSDVSIWFRDSRRAHFTCETSHCIEENCSTTTGVEQQNLNWEKSELLQSTWWKCFLPPPKKCYSATMLVNHKVVWPKHSTPFTKCKTKLTA